jgi:hypothetical protein
MKTGEQDHLCYVQEITLCIINVTRSASAIALVPSYVTSNCTMQSSHVPPTFVDLSNALRRISSVMKMAVFCVVASCSLVEFYQRFRGACCLQLSIRNAVCRRV